MKKFLIIIFFSICSFLMYKYDVHAASFNITDFSYTFGGVMGDMNSGCNYMTWNDSFKNNFSRTVNMSSNASWCGGKENLKAVAINTSGSVTSGYYYKAVQVLKFNGSVEVVQSAFSKNISCGVYNGSWKMDACIDLSTNVTSLSGGYLTVETIFRSNQNGTGFTYSYGDYSQNSNLAYPVNGGSVLLYNFEVFSYEDPVMAGINNVTNSQNTIINQNDVTHNKLDNLKEQQQETNKKLDETNDTLKDSDTSDASNSANSFFDGFESSDFGLSDIITMPLTFINGLSSGTCNSLKLPVPFVNQTIELPCMTKIYEEYFGTFLTLYQLITTGFISYWVCVNIFKMVQNFKSPEKDEIEVMDL